jgi:hypothetical protein
MTEREFMAHLTQARDRLVYLIREGSKDQAREVGWTLDDLIRDIRALHDQPKAR